MKKINLRDYYYWYTWDEFVEVTDEIAEELDADKRYHKAHRRRMNRNGVYSLDAGDGIEKAVIVYDPPPWEIVERMEQYCNLCRALNTLPEIQGRRIDAYFILGKTQAEIAEAEGVVQHSVSESIKLGLRAMRKFL